MLRGASDFTLGGAVWYDSTPRRPATVVGHTSRRVVIEYRPADAAHTVRRAVRPYRLTPRR